MTEEQRQANYEEVGTGHMTEERKMCKRVYHPGRTFGPQLTCSECGFGATDERWNFCPKCGRSYTNTRAQAFEETGND